MEKVCAPSRFVNIILYGKRSSVCSLRLMFSQKYPQSVQNQKICKRLTKLFLSYMNLNSVHKDPETKDPSFSNSYHQNLVNAGTDNLFRLNHIIWFEHTDHPVRPS